MRLSVPLSFHTTPTVRTQMLTDEVLSTAQVSLSLRREDEIHPQVSGNKYRKLKYNLLAAQQQGYRQLLTFGGAYSNHIAATAYAAHQVDMRCIGIIRGEELAEKWQDNPTLQRAHAHGMQLHFISRSDYRRKMQPEYIHALQQQFGKSYIIPEGGTNALAVKGCAEILTPDDCLNYDVICCPVGTGGTLAGLVQAGLDHAKASHHHTMPQILGIAAVAAPSLNADIAALTQTDQWTLNFDYTCGGYAKTSPALHAFMQAFSDKHLIPIEPIYTAKMLYALYDLVSRGYFNAGTRILAIHTGGLQGNQGFATSKH